jgi:hypothetical protein
MPAATRRAVIQAVMHAVEFTDRPAPESRQTAFLSLAAIEIVTDMRMADIRRERQSRAELDALLRGES